MLLGERCRRLAVLGALIVLWAGGAWAACVAGPDELGDAVAAVFGGPADGCDGNADGLVSAADLVAVVKRAGATPTPDGDLPSPTPVA